VERDHRRGRAKGTTDPSAEEAALEEIRAALRGIRFGSVLVKIHDGEVVGIETSTKVRLKGSKS
jgi:hypothetical protein